MSTITGDVVIEAAYNGSETRLDAGLIPVLHLMPTLASTRRVSVPFLGGLDGLRKELAIARFAVLRPSGARTATLSFTFNVGELFVTEAMADNWPADSAEVEGRMELRLEPAGSDTMLYAQKIVLMAPSRLPPSIPPTT
jgi:hypothetical protein